MIYCILMISLIIIATILIVAIKKDVKRSIVILLSLIYNFIIGFFLLGNIFYNNDNPFKNF